MRRHIITIVAAGLLATGCSGGGNDKPEPPAAAAPAATSASPAVEKLSKEWVPKLEAVTDTAASGVCREVGSPGCVDHLTELTSVVYDVGIAIETAGAETRYPRSMKHIDEVEAASEAYVAAECKGETESMLDGTACAGYGGTLLMGPSILMMKLQTDEYSAD